MGLCPSVSVSVTSLSSTKTAKHRITKTTPHDSAGTLVFWLQRFPRNLTGVTPYGAPNAGGVGQNRRISPNNRLYLDKKLSYRRRTARCVVSVKILWSALREQFLHCGLGKFRHSKSSVCRWYPQLDPWSVWLYTYRTMKATRSRHGCVHTFITHCPTVTLQLHNFDLFRTCRTSSFCTVAWQLARFQLTRRIARSLGDSWASFVTCLSILYPPSFDWPLFRSTNYAYAIVLAIKL